MKALLVPDELVQGLERRAASHGRTIEDEHRAILKAAVDDGPRMDQSTSSRHLAKAKWIDHMRQLQKRTEGRVFTPSEALVREMRDER
jgi:plasmid stability protein